MLHSHSSRLSIVFVAAAALATSAQAQVVESDSAAIMQFQRAADAYAFQHRQVQRRLGDGAGTMAMAAAMRAARPSPAEGLLFTPLASAAFRARINAALKAGCKAPNSAGQDFTVPRTNDDAVAARVIPACVNAILPRLPEELEYRAAGVTLVLVDRHANLIVDILHSALPPSATP